MLEWQQANNKILRCRLELIMKDVLKLTEDSLDELVGTMDETNKSILIGVVAGAFDHVLFRLEELEVKEYDVQDSRWEKQPENKKINKLDEVLEREYPTYDEGSDIETLAKAINRALVDLEGLDALCIYRLKDATDFIVESLVELVKRKKEIEELKEEVEESREKRFIIPLPGFMTIDGKQRYLTYKDGEFFANRREDALMQVWKEPHLDLIPQVYREFAVEFEEGMKY